jgi:hypothetical protein
VIKLKLRNISFLTDEEVRLVSGGVNTPGPGGTDITDGCTDCCPSWDSLACPTDGCPDPTSDCE